MAAFFMPTTPWLNKCIWATLVLSMAGIVAVYLRQAVSTPPLPVLHPTGDFQLTNQLGHIVGKSSLIGHPTVVNVIFSRCPTQCHRLSQRMSQLQGKIGPEVQLLSLSADPGYDTPEVLTQYGRKYDADSTHWWFLTGTKAEIYRYATGDLLFTVLENPDPAHAKLEDLFIHSADFAILDGQARLRAVVHGEEPEALAQIVQVLNQLRHER